MGDPKGLAILVGGGPAPGINSVIGAATIRAIIEGVDVYGIQDGFQWVMQGDEDHARRLSLEEVSRIHFRGGSQLGIARANPTRDPKHLENTIGVLESLGVDKLITIGGDDTAFSAMKLTEQASGRIRVAHVPKTIDNDLDLPPYVDTFGYQTARHLGVDIVQNLMVDAQTTSRWYFVVAMGRKAGHLALGIGKAAGATVTLIPEEFGPGKLQFDSIVETLVASILKRLNGGRRDGVAVIAEGVVLSLGPEDLAQLQNVEKDEHGHVRIAEIGIGDILKQAVRERLADLGVKTTIVAKNIGYELRCADPTPSDMEYTRDLGYCAAKFLLEGGNAAMMSLQGGHFEAVPFSEMLDPDTGRTRVRLVDVSSTRYAIARSYMIRLRKEDLDDPEEMAKFCAHTGLSPEEFRARFGPLVEHEPPVLHIQT